MTGRVRGPCLSLSLPLSPTLSLPLTAIAAGRSVGEGAFRFVVGQSRDGRLAGRHWLALRFQEKRSVPIKRRLAADKMAAAAAAAPISNPPTSFFLSLKLNFSSFFWPVSLGFSAGFSRRVASQQQQQQPKCWAISSSRKRKKRFKPVVVCQESINKQIKQNGGAH